MGKYREGEGIPESLLAAIQAYGAVGGIRLRFIIENPLRVFSLLLQSGQNISAVFALGFDDLTVVGKKNIG